MNSSLTFCLVTTRSVVLSWCRCHTCFCTSWVLGGFESAEAEQEHFERWQQKVRLQGEQVQRMGEQMLERISGRLGNLLEGPRNWSERVSIGDGKECKFWLGSRGKLVLVEDVVVKRLAFS